MPGRAMVMVYLAMAMLAAFAIKTQRHRHRRLAAIAVALVLVDFIAAPVPLAPLDCPPVYQALRERPERGAVAALPLGIGDGFGGVTPSDNRTLLACQVLHERPMVGGFVARLAPSVLAAYYADPLLAGWMRLSDAVGFEDVALPSPGEAIDRLHADRITFIVVDRTSASPRLQQAVNELSLAKISEDDRRSLYIVSR